MKHPHIRLASPFLIGALLAAGLSTASAHSAWSTISPPAVRDGSNFSRAPFPAARQFNDVKAMTPAPAAATVSTEPVLTPTGRETITAPASQNYSSARRSAWPFAVTPPAVRDGSNNSRAPFPAARQFDDVKAPDGQAIDHKP